MSKTNSIDCEYFLFADDQARLVTDRVDVSGHPRFDLRALRTQHLDPLEFGTELFRSLFPAGDDPLRAGYRGCLATAEALERAIRFRLHLGRELSREIRELPWEYLYDPEVPAHLACWPTMVFSRYAPGRVPPYRGRPRLLVAIADPSDAEKLGLASVPRDQMEHELREVLEPMARRRYLDFEIFDGPVTPGQLSERLDNGAFQVLHLVAHAGVPHRDDARLVLQSAKGLAQVLDEKQVSGLFLDRRDLRLATLMACDGARHSGEDLWSGLAGRLVQQNLPAVVAMGRPVSLDFASRFSRDLYQRLFRDGVVDIAIREARRQLSLPPAVPWEWSSPVLYMRPADGRLWHRRWWPIGRLRAAGIGGLVAGSLVASGWLSFEPWPGREPAPLTVDSEPVVREPLPRDLRVELEAAASYLDFGSYRASVQEYRSVLDRLPARHYAVLDKDGLQRAQDNVTQRSYRLAAEEYRAVFDDLLVSVPEH